MKYLSALVDMSWGFNEASLCQFIMKKSEEWGGWGGGRHPTPPTFIRHTHWMTSSVNVFSFIFLPVKYNFIRLGSKRFQVRVRQLSSYHWDALSTIPTHWMCVIHLIHSDMRKKISVSGARLKAEKWKQVYVCHCCEILFSFLFISHGCSCNSKGTALVVTILNLNQRERWYFCFFIWYECTNCFSLQYGHTNCICWWLQWFYWGWQNDYT